jgi:hypothetical protein
MIESSAGVFAAAMIQTYDLINDLQLTQFQ